MRRALGVVAALVLVLTALQQPGAPAFAAPVAGTLTVTPASPVMSAEQVRLTGSLPPARARAVVLQRQVGTGAWADVGSMQSRSNGKFTFNVLAPTTSVPLEVGYRVFASAATLRGTAYPAVETPTVSVQVVPQQASLDAPSRVRLNTSYPVTAVFHPARAGRAVVLQRWSGSQWTQVASGVEAANGTATFNRQATPLGNVTWRALARAYRGAPQVATPQRTVTVLASGDVTAPPVPSGLAATGDDTEVTLVWDPVAAGDLAGYRVYRGITGVGPWTALNTAPVTDTDLVDHDPVPGTFYAVASVDVLGNESARSPAVVPSAGDLTPPPVPTGLAAAPDDGRLDLGWDPVDVPDLAGYRVYRSTDGNAPWTTDSGLLTEPSLRVNGLTNGTSYHFRVTSEDLAGNESDPSATVAASPEDRTPPAVPTDPSAHPGDRRVTLSWGTEVPPDLLGFNVWQATSADGPWTLVNQEPIIHPYDVEGLTNGTTYWFSASALDTNGNESERSESVSATPYDNAPPPAPEGLVLTPGDGRIALDWDPVDDDGLVGYRVFRGPSAEGPWTMLNYDPTTDTAYVDEGLSNGTQYFYFVNSVDAAGNHSTNRDAQVGIPVDGTAPAVPTGVRVEVDDEALRVLWDVVADADLLGYQLYRADDEDGPWTNVGELTADTQASVGGLENGTTYWFAVSSADTASNESARSAPVSGVPADLEAPTPPGSLTGDALDRAVSLEWSQVEVLDVVGYRLYRSDSADGPWDQVGDDTQETSAVVSGLTNVASYFFAVTSVDEADNESDRSPVLEIAPEDVDSPLDPAGLTADAGDGRVDLSWDAVTAADLVGYRVYRAVADGGPWTLLNLTPQAGTTYADTGLDNGTEYFYVVTAVDDDQNESGPGSRTRATPADATPPAVPIGLQAVAGDGWVQLDWEAVTESDLAGYRIYRAGAEGGPWTQSGGLVTETQVTVSGLGNGTTYWFSVAAVDQTGNESGRLPPVSATPDAPPDDILVSQLAAGTDHTCRVRDDGSLWCWGRTLLGGVGVPQGPQPWIRSTPIRVGSGSSWVSVEAGWGRTCGIKQDHSLWCWGTRSLGGAPSQYWEPAEVAPGSDWVQVVLGWDHTCGIQRGGTAWCWGKNTDGQLGDGTTTDRAQPTRVGGDTDWEFLGSDAGATCGVRGGQLWCWGRPNFELFGSGSASQVVVLPARLGTATDWTTVSLSQSHACGLRGTGSAWCWGNNTYGQIGNGGSIFDNPATPTQVGSDTDWRTVETADRHSCALNAGGSVWCWGHNPSANLGDGTTVDSRTPVLVGTQDLLWSELDVGEAHACTLTVAGAMYCWGSRALGQLADGPAGPIATPTIAHDGADWLWQDVAVASNHFCGVRDGGSLWCRGYNFTGELGDGTRESTGHGLVRVGADTWLSVTARSSTTCGIKSDRSLWCWGYTAPMNNTGTAQLSPIRIGTSSWSEVSLGSGHTCGIRTDGSLWCWGANWYGQSGDGTGVSAGAPGSRVGTRTDWTQLSAGVNHTCAVTADGQGWCWGLNDQGQLGDGTSDNRLQPTAIAGTTQWARLSAGYDHTCGVAVLGTAWCWGSNQSGKLGDGSFVLRRTPVQLGTESDWAEVKAGFFHSCGVKAAGNLWCWGNNTRGELGDGTYLTRGSPVPVSGNLEVEDFALDSSTCGVLSDGQARCWGANNFGEAGVPVFRATPVPVLD